MEDDKHIIEMTLEGEFVAPPKPPLGTRIMLWAIVATVLAVAVLIVAVTFWFVVMILPLVFLVAVAGYLGWRYQVWRGAHGVRWRGPPGR